MRVMGESEGACKSDGECEGENETACKSDGECEGECV